MGLVKVLFALHSVTVGTYVLVMVLTVLSSGIATVVFECEAVTLELMFSNMFAVISLIFGLPLREQLETEEYYYRRSRVGEGGSSVMDLKVRC